MQARFYLPQYGRLGSPDPARDQHFEQTQSWNIYSYVRNIPTSQIDPTGMLAATPAESTTPTDSAGGATNTTPPPNTGAAQTNKDTTSTNDGAPKPAPSVIPPGGTAPSLTPGTPAPATKAPDTPASATPVPETKTVKFTHYCNCAVCCGKKPTDPAYGITANGSTAEKGTLAAPKTYPFGTTVTWTDPKGNEHTGTVQDRGGAIKGNRIDIWVPTHSEALRQGTYTVDATFLVPR